MRKANKKTIAAAMAILQMFGMGLTMSVSAEEIELKNFSAEANADTSENLYASAFYGLCERELEWKKSTTYTMLRRLCQRNIFQNKDGMVTAILSKQEFQALQSEMFIEETFSGSLPQFLTAFAGRKKLTDTEINELQRLIDQNRRWHDD